MADSHLATRAYYGCQKNITIPKSHTFDFYNKKQREREKKLFWHFPELFSSLNSLLQISVLLVLYWTSSNQHIFQAENTLPLSQESISEATARSGYPVSHLPRNPVLERESTFRTQAGTRFSKV